MKAALQVAWASMASGVGCDASTQQSFDPDAAVTRIKALELAQQSARTHGYDLEKYTLSDFCNDASDDGKEWIFIYLCNPAPAPGCYFAVSVDRATGATKVIPGE